MLTSIDMKNAKDQANEMLRDRTNSNSDKATIKAFTLACARMESMLIMREARVSVNTADTFSRPVNDHAPAEANV